MKKKLFSVALAMVLSLAMGMTALAANSPLVDDTPDQEGFATSASAVVNGQTIELDFTWSDTNMLYSATDAQFEQMLKYFYNDELTEEQYDAQIKSLFETVTGYTASTAAEDAPFVKDFFGLDLPAGVEMPAGGVEVTVSAPYAQAGQNVWFMLHLKADGTWEYIPTTVGNGTLTGRFTSFSPVYVIGAPNAKAPASATPSTPEAPATTTPNTTTPTKAPKTGEFNGIYVAEMLALLSAAGIVVYVKRQKAVR